MDLRAAGGRCAAGGWAAAGGRLSRRRRRLFRVGCAALGAGPGCSRCRRHRARASARSARAPRPPPPGRPRPVLLRPGPAAARRRRTPARRAPPRRPPAPAPRPPPPPAAAARRRHARPGRRQPGAGVRRGEQPEEPRVLGLRGARPELGVKHPAGPPFPRPPPTLLRASAHGEGSRSLPSPPRPVLGCPRGVGALGEAPPLPGPLTCQLSPPHPPLLLVPAAIRTTTSWFESSGEGSTARSSRPSTSPTTRGSS